MTQCSISFCMRCRTRLGRKNVRFSPIDSAQRSRQSTGQHLVHIGDGNDFKPFLPIGRYFSQILLVLGRNEHHFDAPAQSRKQLRSEEHTTELQSLMSTSYSVLSLNKNTDTQT